MNKCYDVFYFLILGLLFIGPSLARYEDYFADSFDETKNCEREDEIQDLMRNSGHERCAVKGRGIKDNKIDF